MLFDPANFLSHLKQIVTGGGRSAAGTPVASAGFLKRAEGVGLDSLLAGTTVLSQITDNTGGTVSATIANTAGANPTTAEFENAIASIVARLNALMALQAGVADETNARVVKVEETVDTVGRITFVIPRDYDQQTDELKLRVLASQLTVSTDNDVQLDMQVYKKRAGAALSADLNPTPPGTVLSTTEQWIEFDLGQNSWLRDDVAQIVLITNGANDTDGEEILIHGVELVYRSTLVSDEEETSAGVTLR